LNSINRLYIVLILTIFISILYLYHSVSDIHDKMVNNIEKIFILKAGQFAKNIDEEIKNHIDKDLYKTLKENPGLREVLEHTFSVVITPSFKYIYVLYKDSNGKYRYLLDGSKEDKGEFNQKLNVNEEKWDQAYNTLKPQIILQKNIDGLWITYLKPIIYDNRVEGVIAIDFSTNLSIYISKLIAPIQNVFLYIFAAIVVLLSVLLYQVILNIKTKKESITDSLTQVYNRTFLRDFLKKIHPEKYQIAMLDIDFFKKINDNYGHKAGDYILSEVAIILKKIVREKDIIIRFGGEEFLIFFYKLPNDEDIAASISHRIREELENSKFVYDDTSIKVTTSIGVMLHPQRCKSVSDAIKKADQLLYIAKKEGRNKVVLEYDAIKAISTETNSIYEVKEALDDNRIICHYQPIINLDSCEVVKYEALVRMVSKDGTIIYPNNFLDAISGTNVYNDLTKRVIDIAFETIKKEKVSLSINLNLSDILNNMIYKIVIDEIVQNKEVAKWLTIELLEYEQLNTDILKQRLYEIKSYGIKIALDDFGSGYSNFAIFQSYPIDILKIDGSLIKEIDSSKVSYTIIESIALFSRKLEIETVAEFIHNDKVLKIIKDLGISYGQGFYIGEPVEKIVERKNETIDA